MIAIMIMIPGCKVYCMLITEVPAVKAEIDIEELKHEDHLAEENLFNPCLCRQDNIIMMLILLCCEFFYL